MKYAAIQEIENSLINGQRQQAFNQILNYGHDEFFSDYKEFLSQMNPDNAFDRYSDAVECFVKRI